MMSFRRRGDRLGRELRAQRPEPRADFLHMLEDGIGRKLDRRRAGVRFRLGLAGALTVGLVTALGSFGGLGYAATGVGHAWRAASHVAVGAHPSAAAPRVASAEKTVRASTRAPARDGAPASVDVSASAPTAAPTQKPASTETAGSMRGLTSAMGQYRVPMCLRGHTIFVNPHAVHGLLAAGATLGRCTEQQKREHREKEEKEKHGKH
jgi:hypothetical protein